jgi:hypothetical protein
MLIDRARDYKVQYSLRSMNVDRGEKVEIVRREKEERACIENKRGHHSRLCH